MPSRPPRAHAFALAVILAAAFLLSCESTTPTPSTPDYVCEAVPLTVVPQGQKLIIAHRGASRAYPENSTEALVAAAESGANAVEFDVVLSADGVLVVMHDDTLDRMSDCTGDIRAMKWADIEGCKLDGRYPVPRLDTLLPKLLGYRKVFVEVKVEDDRAADAAAAVGKVVQELVAYDQVVVTSYNLRVLYELKTRFPEPRIHIGYDGQDVMVSLATVNMGFDYMLMSYSDIDRCVFSLAEQMRVKLVTYTVADKDDLFVVHDGLFRDHAYGVMFDDLGILRENRDNLERKLGRRLDGPKECERGGHVWDKESWACLDPCQTTTCPSGQTCDMSTGHCYDSGADVQAIQTLFASLGPVIEAGRRATLDDDAEGLAAATATLKTLVDAESPYHDRVDLLAFMLFSEADPRAEVLDWTNVGAVVVHNPRATLATRAGTEWFFWYGDDGWKLGFVQTP